MEIKKVKLSALRLNPDNPRIIKDEKFKKLVKSILTFPKMLELREIVTDETMMVLGGNMRFRALQEIASMTENEIKSRLKQHGREDLTDYWIAWHDCPMETVKIGIGLTDAEKKEFIDKDNLSYGEWDWDSLANQYDIEVLQDWGHDVPIDWGTSHTSSSSEKSDDEIYEEKKKEFEERMAAGENVEEDEEYQEFLKKFEAKKTTDDCYTPELIYDAVVEWVEKEYGVKRKDFVRPFYPGGDYQNFNYPKGSVVVDNPPFSILAEILQFYDKKGIKFFLFAPSLTLFSSPSSSSTAICIGVDIIYANGAGVKTSFLTNLGDRSIRFRSAPDLYKALDIANTENLKQMRKELPKYTYPDHIVTSTFVGRMSKYGVDFSVSVDESEPISALDHQKKEGKAIYGKGYIISEKAAAEKAAAEKAAAEKAAAEKAAAEKAAAEKAAAEKAAAEKAAAETRWQLSDKEWEIIKKLSQ